MRTNIFRKNNSIGKEIDIEEAAIISDEWIAKLKPYCHKISSAGTVRRKDRETTNDIDVVLIRDPGKQKEFSAVLDALENIKGKSDGKWCMRKLENGAVLDVRMCEEDDWGWNLFRHTGPTSFHLFALDELDGKEKNFKTEDEVFDALGIDFVEPGERGIFETKENNAMNWIELMKSKKQIGTVSVRHIEGKKHEKHAEISIRGLIGDGFFERGVTDKTIANALKEVGKVDVLDVRINSGGGSVFDAFSIFTQFRRFDAKIVTIIEGIAASAAAFISQAGDEREMSDNALFMIHRASGFAGGNEDIVSKLLNLLRKIDSIMRDTFKKTSNLNIGGIKDLMKDETFLTAQEALEKGFIDTITEDSDVEPHISPDDNQDEVFADIYKHHAKNFETNEHSFDSISELVENELTPDKFSIDPYRPVDFSELSISHLPCVKDGIVNINGLRYLKARLPLTVIDDDVDSKKREAIETWISIAESKFDVEKQAGKYKEDKNSFRIALEVDVAGKTQIFIQTEENIQMDAFIMNYLGVKDETELLDAMTKLKESGLLTSNAVPPVASTGHVVPTTTTAPEIITTVAPDAERMSKIELQVAQVLTQNATLIADNTRKDSLLDVSISKVEEVIQFKNQSLLDKRRKVIDELFYDKNKLSPVQYEKAKKDFVEIEPKDVPETESLYNLSIQLFKTNDVNEKMHYLRGDGGDPEVVEASGTKYEKALDAIIKEKGWNPDDEGDLTKAMAILEKTNPKLTAAVVEDSKVKE